MRSPRIFSARATAAVTASVLISLSSATINNNVNELTFLQPVHINVFEPHPLQPHADLQKRDGNCPSNYGSCASAGSPAFCCQSGTVCSSDDSGHIACCPNGQICRGSLGVDGNNNCRSGWYSCRETFPNGCCINGQEFCGNGRCVALAAGIDPIVNGVHGLYTSAANGAVGVYRQGTDSAGKLYTTFVGDAGQVYTSFRDDFTAAESWVGGKYTGATQALAGAFSTATARVGADADAVSSWYASVTSRFGSDITSAFANGRTFVTSVVTDVAGVLTTQAITLSVPSFAGATGTIGVGRNAAPGRYTFMATGAGPAMGLFIWAWAIGLGLFVAMVGVL